MNKKIYFTDLIISVMGVLTLFFTFFISFKGKDNYKIAAAVITIVVFCAAFAAVNVFVKKAWIVYTAILMIALLYVFIFRYEIIGGYMQFYNRIADAYYKYFKKEMYFANPSGKWKTEASTVNMLFFTLIIICMAYSVIIHTRKATVFPILVNIGLFVVVTIIDKTPPVLYMTGSFIFVVQMIVISCISGNGSSSVNARFNIQAVSVGIACLLAVIMFIASRIVPLKSYQKAGYFDKVYSYVSSVYSNVYDRIASSGGVGKNIANDMIDNGRLGKLDSIHYSYQEMVQADVEADAGKVYIKHYIGQKYKNNTWFEPDREDYESRVNYHSPESTGTRINSYALYYENYGDIVDLRSIRIRYTNFRNNHQLMPPYPMTGMSDYYDYEDYFKRIDENDDIIYWDVRDYGLIEEIANLSGNTDLDYEKYVYRNYLETNEKCNDEFTKLLAPFTIKDVNSYFEIADYCRQYLAKRCTYTLSPGRVPDGLDLVDYFYNDSKKGYCTYFASTVVMMLRSKGIPARYISGFSFEPTDNVLQSDGYINTVSIDDSKAHAWVEFYINGFGWVTYDVTPGCFDERNIDLPEEETTENSLPEEETTTPKESESNENKTTAPTENKTTKTAVTEIHKLHLSKTAIKNIICGAAVIVVLIIGFLIISIRHRVIIANRKFKYNECLKNDIKKCIAMNYEQFLSVYGFIKIVRRENETYREFGNRIIKENSYISEDDMDFISCLMEKADFSKYDISIAEVHKFKDIVDELSSMVYTEVGFFKRIIFKYFRNCI